MLLRYGKRKGRIRDLEIAIVGDIIHSRVAKSNIYSLIKLGAKVRLIGPPTLIPEEIKGLGIDIFHNMEDGLKDADVLMMLRIQMERQGKGFFPSTDEYSKNWGLNSRKAVIGKG